jgi:hypothetical protein
MSVVGFIWDALARFEKIYNSKPVRILMSPETWDVLCEEMAPMMVPQSMAGQKAILGVPVGIRVGCTMLFVRHDGKEFEM